MQKGTKVKMSEKVKQEFIANNCQDHVSEFGNCIGIVQGHVVGPDGKEWPELDVRWQPSNLRYCYHPDDLEVIDS